MSEIRNANEIVNSLPSLYNLQDFEDKAISELCEFVENELTPQHLTLEQLKVREKPVWLKVDELPFGGYWCLCAKGIIITPSGNCYDAKDIPIWEFYDREPKLIY